SRAPTVQDAGLAGARRWEGHAHHIVPHARRAHGPSAERVAGSDGPGGGGDEARRRDLTRVSAAIMTARIQRLREEPCRSARPSPTSRDCASAWNIIAFPPSSPARDR